MFFQIPRVSPKIAQDGYKTRQTCGQDAPRCAQDAPRRAKMRPRRAQDEPRWPQDGAKTRPRRTQDAPERMKLRPICPNMGRRLSQDVPRCFPDVPGRSQDVPKTLQKLDKDRPTDRPTGSMTAITRFPFPYKDRFILELFRLPRRAQDAPRRS